MGETNLKKAEKLKNRSAETAPIYIQHIVSTSLYNSKQRINWMVRVFEEPFCVLRMLKNP